MKKFIALVSALMLLVFVLPVWANHLQVGTPTITDVNTTGNYAFVQFNLSWENSFKDDINWDAAWVFVKYKVAGGTEWKHAYLNTTASNHVIPDGYPCEETSLQFEGAPSPNNMGPSPKTWGTTNS